MTELEALRAMLTAAVRNGETDVARVLTKHIVQLIEVARSEPATWQVQGILPQAKQ